MTAKLHDWQLPSANRLIEIFETSPIALNASETGVGKTYVAAHVVKETGVAALIICPKGVISTWRNVFKDFGIESQLLDVLNIEKIQTEKTKWWDGAAWHVPQDTLIIWDEIHKGASGPNTHTTKMLGLTKAFKLKVLAQSATIADSPLKLRGLGFLLGLHDYNKGSFYDWALRHGCFRSQFHSGVEFGKGPKAKEALKQIHEQIKDRLVRVTTGDAPGFPESLVESRLYDLESDHTEAINKIYEEMDAELKKPDHPNPLVAVMRARQKVELFKVPLLTELTEDFLADNKSVVIFVCFKETLRLLTLSLDAVEIHGDQEPEERDEMIRAFQANEKHVCVAITQAGGVGISLHDVRHERPRVSLITPGWSSVDFLQCLGRIRRDGGTPVIQQVILAAGTVEERVHRALKRKLNNIELINNGDLV